MQLKLEKGFYDPGSIEKKPLCIINFSDTVSNYWNYPWFGTKSIRGHPWMILSKDIQQFMDRANFANIRNQKRWFLELLPILKCSKKATWLKLNYTEGQQLPFRGYLWKIHEKSDNNDKDNDNDGDGDNYWMERRRGVILVV